MPLPTLQRRCLRRGVARGFTLLETVIVLVVVGLLAAIAIPKAFNPGALTLKAQARQFASDLQRAQLLASTSGVAVQVEIKTTSYTVKQGIGGMPAETVTLQNGATFVSGATTTLTFDTLGQPFTDNVLAFQLADNATTPASSANVKVEAVSGLITGP